MYLERCMNSAYNSNNLERCMNSAYIKVVSSIIFDFGFVCCWFYPFWFFEFSVVIRFIIDDSFNRVAVAQVFICTPSDPQERPRGFRLYPPSDHTTFHLFLDSSFIIILVGCECITVPFSLSISFVLFVLSLSVFILLTSFCIGM